MCASSEESAVLLFGNVSVKQKRNSGQGIVKGHKSTADQDDGQVLPLVYCITIIS